MKHLFALIFLFSLWLNLLAQEDTSRVNFNDLSINQLIELCSKLLNKNILSTEAIEGKVDFVSHAPLDKEQLMELLTAVLHSKGYVLEDEGALLKIKKKEVEEKKEVEKEKEKEELFFKMIPLKNAEVKNILPLLQEIFNHKQYRKNEIKPLISQDAETNSLIIHASLDIIEHITSIIEDLDVQRMQVYVEAKIIELSENKSKNLGLKYGLSAANSTSSNIFTLGTNFGGVSNALDTATSALFTIPTQTLQSAVALGATLNILKINQVIDIVSEPSVLCVNNKLSSIYVGETKSFQTGLSVTDGGKTNSTYQRENIGLTLKVKPRISTQNRVILEISAILEDARELQPNQTNPDTTKKEIQAHVIVNNAESVILGGLIKSKSDVLNTTTPFLGEIPLIKGLFNNTKEVEDKVNLVVIITPFIIPESKDLTFIREQLSQLKHLEEQYTLRLEEALEKNMVKNTPLSTKEKEQTLAITHENILQKELTTD